MSDIINHYFCGLEAINKLEINIKSKIDPALFFLGAQGPDIFLYYNIFHFNSPISYGKTIHHTKVNLFFYNLYKYIDSIEDEEIYNKLFSYLCGFSCHHALDSITHPYIIYHSGIYDKKDRSTRVYNYIHKKFEVLLDVAMLKYQYNLLANEFNIQHIFALDFERIFLLENLYQKVLMETYRICTSSRIVKNSINSQKVILSFLNNPDSLKGKFIATLEKIVLKKGFATNAMYPRETNVDLILNLDEHNWTHPCDEKQNFNSSYVTLFQDAVNTTIYNINALFKLKYKQLSNVDIDDIFHDISYLTGKPCSSGGISKHFNKQFADKLITM
ncbi:hypothetical protein GC105_04180 [Alkalibaculum sp. M08DMB]|uniref:Phospholipase C/D domain-containing protein n=1 Tax=Alkalibaculum sporogenes TaxID=2655001 RepID=A0A6A7K6D7_9FIRM|nr:zinc dependent phospholipase C family protein [Alkalibaculum sporogenes]MPW24986.1 hypothetical protein [Alkalibaculum sporogenes]